MPGDQFLLAYFLIETNIYIYDAFKCVEIIKNTLHNIIRQQVT